MPVNIIIGLVALLVALVLYSIGTWGVFRAKAVTKRQVVYLFVGFGFDVLATAMMAISAGGLDLAPLSHLLHTILAFVGMFGMLAAAIVANRAVSSADRKAGAALAKWILAPWAVWVFVFVWGMISRAPRS